MMGKVLILTPYFKPGYKAGGPIRSISNLIDFMSDKVQFDILTPDHDLGETKKYDGIKSGTWIERRGFKVRYIASGTFIKEFKKVLRSSNGGYEAIYMNSFFHPKYSILAFLLNKFSHYKINRVVIAPRGEFSESALRMGKFKKRIYLFFFKSLGFHKSTVWQASTDLERRDIQRVLGSQIRTYIAENVPTIINDRPNRRLKNEGELSIVFMSRIAPMKNLKGAIEVLSQAGDLEGKILFDIYGPQEDTAYWDDCVYDLEQLPSNIEWRYVGLVSPEKVSEILSGYHLFFLPTLGENYGHAIVESLSSGTPVLISNRTPWLNLAESKIGWDVPLDCLNCFIEKIEIMLNMDDHEFQKMSSAARSKAESLYNDFSLSESYIKLFDLRQRITK